MEETTPKSFWIALTVVIVLAVGGFTYWATHHQTNAEKLQSATQKADQSKKNLDTATKKYEDVKAKAE